MKLHLNSGVFKILNKLEVFNSVKTGFDTISWNEEVDLRADYLYETSEEI